MCVCTRACSCMHAHGAQRSALVAVHLVYWGRDFSLAWSLSVRLAWLFSKSWAFMSCRCPALGLQMHATHWVLTLFLYLFTHLPMCLPWCVCVGQKTTCKSQISASAGQSPWIELRWLGWAASLSYTEPPQQPPLDFLNVTPWEQIWAFMQVFYWLFHCLSPLRT